MFNKKELALLEKAFAAEIEAALSKSGLYMMQTRSKLAESLVDEGLLVKVTENFGNYSISGYALTEAGRLCYCMSQRDTRDDTE